MSSLHADPPGSEADDAARTDAAPAPGEPGGSRPRRRVPAQLMCLGYMIVLVLVAIGIDRGIASRLFADPGQFVPAYRSFQDYDVGAKLGQFRGVENDHFDGFFIGNSRTNFGVNPAVFDRASARAGQHTHTYN